MARIVCQVLHRSERITFIWSEGSASFAPYHLRGPKADEFRQLSTLARERLATRNGPELVHAGQQLYGAIFPDDPVAQEIRTWLAEALGKNPQSSLEILSDLPGVPWNVVNEQDSFWGMRYNMTVGRRANPLRQVPFLQKPEILLIADPVLMGAVPEGEKNKLAEFAQAKALQIVDSRTGVETALQAQPPEFIYLFCRAHENGFPLGNDVISTGELARLLKSGGQNAPEPMVFINLCRLDKSKEVRLGKADLQERWQSLGLNGLIASEQPVPASEGNAFGVEFLARFLYEDSPLGAALRGLRTQSGTPGLLYSAFCPAHLRVTWDETAESDLEGPPPGPLPDQPYRPLAPYDREDRALFSGRDEDVAEFAVRLDRADTRMLILHGPSGVGKSSFLRAGVVPFLEDVAGFRALRDRTPEKTPVAEGDYPVLSVRATHDLAGQLAEALCAFCSQPYSFTTPAGKSVSVDLPGILASMVNPMSTAIQVKQSPDAVSDAPQPPPVLPPESEKVTPRLVWEAMQNDLGLLSRLLSAITEPLPQELVILIEQGEEVFTQATRPVDRRRRRQALNMLTHFAASSSQCKVILSIRTEYLGRLLEELPLNATFLLRELTDDEIVEAIILPTATDLIPGSTEAPNQKYQFLFEEGVPEAIVRMTRESRQGNESVLALVHASCAQLHEKLQDREDKVIRPNDLLSLPWNDAKSNRQALKQTGFKNMALGGVIFLVGVGFSTLLLGIREFGGWWVIALGAMVYGALQFFRGSGQYAQAAEGPTTVTMAGIIWTVFGGFIGANLVIAFFLSAGAIIFTLVAILGALFALAFIFVGVQTIRGTAPGSVASGIGSIIFGLIIGLPLVNLYQGGYYFQFGMTLFFALALIAAGILAIVGGPDYKIWRQSKKAREQGDDRDRDYLRRKAVPPGPVNFVMGNFLEGLLKKTMSDRECRILKEISEPMYEGGEGGLWYRKLIPQAELAKSWRGPKPLNVFLDLASNDKLRFLEVNRCLIGGNEGNYVTLSTDNLVPVVAEWKQKKNRGYSLDDIMWIVIPVLFLVFALTLFFARQSRAGGKDGGDSDEVVISRKEIQQSIKENQQIVGDMKALAFPLYAGNLSLADQSLQAGNTLRLRQLLLRHQKNKGQTDFRSFEWFYLWGQGQQQRHDLVGHLGLISSVAATADGKFLASGSLDGTVNLWDGAGGQKLATFLGHDGPVHGVAFSPDGKKLVSAGADKSVQVWNVEVSKAYQVLKKPAKTLEGHKDAVLAVAFSSDNQTVASGSADKTVILWNVNKGEKQVLKEHKGAVQAVTFAPDGKTLASAGADRLVCIWNVANASKQFVLERHTGPVFAVAFSPDGNLLASAGEDKKDNVEVGLVRFWDSVKGKPAGDPGIMHSRGVFAMSFAPDGKALVTGGKDNLLRVWNPANGKPLGVLPGHLGWVRSLAIPAKGRRIISGSFDRTVKIWDAGPRVDVLRGHKDWVCALAFSADDRFLASGSRDGTVRIWNAGDGRLLDTLEGLGGSVLAVAFSPSKDNPKLAAGIWTDKGAVKVWDIVLDKDKNYQKAKEAHTLLGHKAGVACLAFDKTGKRLASGSGDKTIILWDLAGGKPERTLSGHEGGIRCLAWAADDRLASGSDDGTIRIWQRISDKEVGPRFEGHSAPVNSLALIDDDVDILISGSNDQTVKIWRTGKVLATFRGHANAISAVALTTNAKNIFLASAGWDNTIKIWDMQNPGVDERFTFTGHTGPVRSLAISSDGRTLASASNDGSVRLWRAASEKSLPQEHD